MRGKPVDKRADIWAFGCVSYELLTRTPRVSRRDIARHDCAHQLADAVAMNSTRARLRTNFFPPLALAT
jgi:serine/threonine protein kinase